MVHIEEVDVRKWLAQQQRRRPPRLLMREIGQSHAPAGYKVLPVLQRCRHFLIARGRIDLERFKPYDRYGVAYGIVMCIGIGEERFVEGIERRVGTPAAGDRSLPPVAVMVIPSKMVC